MNKIFSPYILNDKISLRNRLLMAPMTTWSGNEDGSISDQELAYYRHRSNGVAMLITGTTYSEESGKGFRGQFYGGSDDTIASLRSLSEAIHSGGAKAILQIFHAGRKANPSDLPEGVSLSASAVAGKREENNIPRAMTEEEINATIEAFKQVTLRAHKAGFDGVEIHGANTYLLQQFFSPHSNIREDKWGGSLENRARFPLAVIEACMDAKEDIDNPNFIIGYRFSPEENSEPGISLSDTEFLIDRLCETDLDYLHISLGHFEETSMRDESDKTKTLERIVKHINGRKAFVGVGSVYTAEDASKLLDYGVDLIALGRQLLVDARSVEKWSKGEEAFKYYSPSRKEEELMPDELHNVITSREGWVPVKK